MKPAVPVAGWNVRAVEVLLGVGMGFGMVRAVRDAGICSGGALRRCGLNE